MKHWKSLVGASVLALAMTTGIANAQEPPKHANHLEFMATALDLTEAQVAQIKQIQGERKAAGQADHQQMKALHEQFQALVTSDNFDEAKASGLISQIQQHEAARMLEHAKEMNAIYKILTPQQKAKAVKLFSEMHGGMGHGGMGHGGPGSDGPPAAPPQE